MRAGIDKPKRIEPDAGELERYWIEQNCTNAILKGADCEQKGDLAMARLYRFVESLCVKALDRFGGGSLEVRASDHNSLPSCSADHVKPAESLSTVLLRMLKDGKSREINGIVFASGKPASEVLSELLKLELSGKVKKLPMGRYQRK